MIEEIRHPNPSKPERTLVQVFVQDCGLANQMFEIAAGYGIAKRLGMHFRWSWNPSRLRNFEMGCFGFTETRYPEVPVVASRMGQGNISLVKRAEEAVRKSDDKWVGISCPFQAEECFIEFGDEIRGMFKLEPFDLPHPEGTTPVGVQVRRGDYVKHPRLNVTTPQYFLDALEWMRARVPNPHFIIVSDDHWYCEKLFEKQFDVTVMPPQDSVDGLRTLASCSAHVISNSTFGWWGAWLGEDGPVVVPDRWHNKPGSYGNWNPVPERWHRLPTGAPEPPREVIKPRVVIETGDPGVERAIVYPWHADGAKWEELRYSLRSVAMHFEDKDCPIHLFATRRPDWLKDGCRVEYRGAFTYSEALSYGLQSADKVLWMNDDVVLLKPVGWGDCAVPRYLREVGPDFLKNAETFSNPWHEGCLKVLKQLHGMGHTEQKVFSTHTPYVFEREKSLEVFREFGVFEKFPMELAYFHLFGEGARPLGGDRTQDLPNDSALFLNYVDQRLEQPGFKEALMSLFPEKAEWEI